MAPSIPDDAAAAAPMLHASASVALTPARDLERLDRCMCIVDAEQIVEKVYLRVFEVLRQYDLGIDRRREGIG